MKLESIFQNGMVFQRNKPIRIFGTGEGVATATLCGNTASSEATKWGWLITLPALEAGGPYTVDIDLNGEKCTLSDVYVGEVFIASGQSNMEMPLFRTQNGFDEAKHAEDSLIRFFNVPKRQKEGFLCWNRHFEPVYNKDTEWQICTEESALHFSAIGYYYAKFLRAELDVPVGIISCNWGGRVIRTFIPYEDCENEPAMANEMEAYKKALAAISDEEYEKEFARFTKEMEIQCRSTDDTFENTRLFGNKFATAHDITVAKYAKGMPYGKYSPDRPGGLWSTMVRRICPFSVKGVLWYQGESDSRTTNYFEKYRTMLNSWRREFMDPTLPFFAVELAPFRRDGTYEEQTVNIPGFHTLREVQQKCADELENSYLAALIDCGDEFDIHPENKKTPAYRLWLLAAKYLYGMDVTADAPRYESHRFLEDTAAIIKVKNAKKLFASGIRNFWMAGDDAVFYPCRAILAGDTEIRIRAPRVKEPKYIRYAFMPYPEQEWIANEAGLPLMPFRTDNFTTITLVRDITEPRVD
ncbi:MAG: hypothetical protein II370_01180 [Clostridia bacterium]|nr:hypothetical protein [Clostridia bacterium]